MANRAKLLEAGKKLRGRCPRGSHARWKAPRDRPTALRLVVESDQGRIPELIPLRHGRMLESPFTFYRGSALSMATDLAQMPTTGIRVQCCGDAHLGNFRCFATPERRIIFDIHDLDETLPAPWDWDVKRLAASFVVASRNNGLSDSSARDAVLACVGSYREHMARFSEMKVLDVWYSSFDPNQILSDIKDPEARARAKARLTQAKEQTALEYDFPKLVGSTDQTPKIKDHPPLIYHWRKRGHRELETMIQNAFARYRATLPDDRRVLLDRFEFKDLTIKVVGVGSVGTYCMVMLLMAGEKDPLFLQVKQAKASVLEAFAGKSVYANHGERVVQGHRLMQSASDVFLGWTRGRFGRDYYIRQLRDAKIKFAIETFGSAAMELFGKWCGATLARAHARSGEPALIAGYLGNSDKFDQAIADFSISYADQIEEDHKAIKKAAKAGKLKVLLEKS